MYARPSLSLSNPLLFYPRTLTTVILPKASLYFRNLRDKNTFDSVVDEIYENCSYVFLPLHNGICIPFTVMFTFTFIMSRYLTPWEHGTHSDARRTGLCSAVRGVGTEGRPTSAFVLLVKLFTLRPTRRQIQSLLDHGDSVFIRGCGFLFIRYLVDPEKIWGWMSPYLSDEDPIQVEKMGPTITIGSLVRSLISNPEYYGTHLPRLAVRHQQAITRQLDAWIAAHPEEVAATSNVASYSESKDDRERHHSSRERSRSRERSLSRERGRGRDRDRRDIERARGGRGRSRSRDRGGRERSRSRDRGDRGRSRSRDRSRRDRSRSRDRGSRRHRSRDRGRRDHRDDLDRDRRGRNHSRSRSRDRSRRGDRDRRSRSRSRDRRDRDRAGRREYRRSGSSDYERDLESYAKEKSRGHTRDTRD